MLFCAIESCGYHEKKCANRKINFNLGNQVHFSFNINGKGHYIERVA